jgi:hypothetical protein
MRWGFPAQPHLILSSVHDRCKHIAEEYDEDHTFKTNAIPKHAVFTLVINRLDDLLS